MAISSVSSAGSTPPVTSGEQAGLNGLTSNDFLKLLITQLQNQDPTQPTSNEELLQQLSAMRGLQSNIELSSTLKSFSNNQQIASGATFLGKTITGTNASNQVVTGIADRVFLQNGNPVLGIGDESVPLTNVTGVNLTNG